MQFRTILYQPLTEQKRRVRKMRFVFKLKTKSFTAEIEDEVERDVFEFIKELIDFIESNRDFFSLRDISIDSVSQIRSTSEREAVFPEPAIKLASDSRLTPELLSQIYDFESEDKIPPLTVNLVKNTRVENQRYAILLLLFANAVINQKNSVPSSKLTDLLIKSNIDPIDPYKAFRGEFAKYVRLEKRTYNLTGAGKVKAREVLKELTESLA